MMSSGESCLLRSLFSFVLYHNYFQQCSRSAARAARAALSESNADIVPDHPYGSFLSSNLFTVVDCSMSPTSIGTDRVLYPSVPS